MKKAVFFDIDGTLLESNRGQVEISPCVCTAIKELQSAGHYALIATGRPYAFISEALWKFGFDGFVLSNGAYVMIDNKTVYMEAMEKKQVKALVEELNQSGLEFIVEGEKYSYIDKQYNNFFDYCLKVGISPKFIKRDYKIEEVNTFKIEVVCPNQLASTTCLKILEGYTEYTHFSSMNAAFFEIYSKQISKAVGIQKALDYLGVSIENSYAFGDGINDIEMLSAVECGIVMGNASNEVKAYADREVATVGEDGVAEGIYKYILKEELESHLA